MSECLCIECDKVHCNPTENCIYSCDTDHEVPPVEVDDELGLIDLYETERP